MSARTGGPPGRLDGGAATASGGGPTRLRLYRNPLRLAVSASTWRAAWYLIGYVFGTGWLLFAATFPAVTGAAALTVTLAGIPLLVAAAGVLRGCASVERRRLRQVFTEPVRDGYQPVTRPGLFAEARARWRDRATWRDVAYLIGLWPPLLILDSVVLAVWAWFIGMISLPLWYWAPWREYHGVRYHGYELGFYFPHGPHGPGAVGVFIGSLPAALAAAAVGLAGFLACNYLIVITARAHARVARSVLRAPADPLAEAKEVLTRPGPLGPLRTDIPDRS